MELLDFITKSHEAQTDDQLFGLFKNYLYQFGFDSLIFCLMTDHASIGEPAKHGKITGYPEDWMKHYIASNYEPIDPIRKEVMLEKQRIFTWDGIDRIRPYNKEEHSILNQSKDAGLKDGVAVSLQNVHNEVIALGFASSTGGVELDPKTLSVLKLISIQFYDMYQALKKSSVREEKDKTRIQLSKREREVLQWSSLGKSNPDIGTILNISERTVNFHLQQCFAKLQVNCKTLAVVKALRLSLIQLDDDFDIVIPKNLLDAM